MIGVNEALYEATEDNIKLEKENNKLQQENKELKEENKRLKEYVEYWQEACDRRQDKICELLAKLEGISNIF